MFIPNSEQTCEKAELEGPGYHDDPTVVRKQAVAQFTTSVGESPGPSVLGTCGRRQELFLSVSRGHLVEPKMGGLTIK